jgi:hypothetical protein
MKFVRKKLRKTKTYSASWLMRVLVKSGLQFGSGHTVPEAIIQAGGNFKTLLEHMGLVQKAYERKHEDLKSIFAATIGEKTDSEVVVVTKKGLEALRVFHFMLNSGYGVDTAEKLTRSNCGERAWMDFVAITTSEKKEGK